ncbi:BspA family leucine-rich repeat surface protein [uncultured Aquimarina sp.]|uniref:BspA family leucine-rich repeat surface protein n=1 Tax=uncultured Aquimarina sp. TaxID=575652 RepID=UPI00260871B0|nr:BspA family leucine-rich repeat surface protein [uncultured Aquimarina sp.]
MKHFYITLFFIVSFFTAGFAQSEFITTWQTTTVNESITIPTIGSGYNYTVDWGDGTIETGFIGDASHTYASSGMHTVTITGDFPRIYFNNRGDKSKIRTVEQWGTISWSSMEAAFYGCDRLELDADDTPDFSAVTSLSQMFRNAFSLVDRKNNIENWDVNTITDMSSMFQLAPDFNENIGVWDVGSVTDFSSMFEDASDFNQNLNNWNIGERVIGTIVMNKMFRSSTKFNGPLNNWDVSKVINMESMFDNAHGFNQPLNLWDVGEVTNMKFMFFSAWRFNQALGDWDISSVNDMSSMLDGTNLSIGNYDATLIGWATDSTDIPENISFRANSGYCLSTNARNKLTSAPYSWDISDGGQICNFNRAFTTTWQTTGANENIIIPTTGAGYDYLVDWGDGTAITSEIGNATHTYTTAGSYEVKIIGDFPRIYFGFLSNNENASKLQSIKQWGSQQWTSMEYAFSNCINVVIDATDTPDLTGVTSMRGMFNECRSISDNGGGIGDWNVSAVEDMNTTFRNSSFNENINNWDVRNVGSFYGMFQSATNFNQPLNNWRLNSATTTTQMFSGATQFDQDLSDWNTDNITRMNGMFQSATSFNRDLSNWNVSKVEKFQNMFSGATAFNQSLGSWDISSANAMVSMFNNSGLSTANYDATLIGWATQDTGEMIPSNINISFLGSQYCFGTEARNTLTDPTGFNWNITDDGAACATADFFITTWETTVNNQSITFPTTGNGYDYSVDWGDGTIQTGFTGNASHSYATAGIHTVRIIGDFPRIYFNNGGGYKNRIRTIEQWGSISWTSMERAFYGCNSLELNADDTPDLSATTNLSRMFWGAVKFIDRKDTIGNWDVSTITDMSYMFRVAIDFDEDIGNWDVGSVTNFTSMFDSAYNFNQNLNDWNIGERVTGTINMSEMFARTRVFNSPLNNWNVSKVTNMLGMFNEADNFNQPLNLWDVSEVSNMRLMFLRASRFNQTLGDWDIGNVSSISNMLDQSGLSTENYDTTLIGWVGNSNTPSGLDLGASNLTYCFGTDARNTLTDPTGFNWNITDDGTACDLTEAFITTWRINSNNEEISFPIPDTGLDFIVDWGDGTITNEIEEAYHTYANAGTYTIRILGNFNRLRFNDNADSDKILTIEQWGSNTWTSMEDAFRGCTNLEVKATDSPDLSNVTSLAYMFAQCSSLDKDFPVDFSGWDTSGIQDFTWAFADAVAFNSSSIVNWDVSEATTFGFMFVGATAFDQDLSAWDISSAQTMESMLQFTSMSEENYDKTLIGWATLDTASGETQIPSNVDLEVDATYCLGVNAKNTLLNAPYDWTIDDGGLGCPNEDLFITTWNIATDFEFITLPVVGSGLDFVVDWGDGTVTFETQEAYHTYENAGTYTMRILGDFNRINFDGYPSSEKIVTIEQWGPNFWTSMEDAFNGCINLKLNADDVPDLSSVSSTQRMFQGCTNLEDLQDKMNDWDMSAVIDTRSMFENCSLFNEVISDWNVTNVRTMNAMFQSATAFNQSLGSWDISAANTMDNMLVDAGMSSENYDKTLIGWATLEAGETQIPSDITFDASAAYCLGEAARNILTDASGLNWIISDDGLGCAPTDAFITTWTVADGGQITIPNFSMFIAHNYNVDWGDGTFSIGNTSSTSHTYTSGGTYTVSITGNMPTIFFGIADNTTKESLQTIEQWGNQKWEYLNAGFAGCTNLKLNADDTPDLSVVSTEDIGSMFNGCTNFEDLKDQIGNWDMSQVQDISFMFFNCSVFNEDISTWSFDNLTSTTNTFSNALSFNQDISNWDMSNLVRAADMFKGASSFNQNLTSWDLSSLTTGLDEIFVGTALSQENYDNTLIGWATLEAGETQIPTGIDLVADATYCLAEAARNTLLSAPYNWSITDGGLGCIDPIITLIGDNPQTIEKGDAYTELGVDVTYGAIVTINATSVDTDVVGSYTVTYDATNTVSGATATQVTRMVEVVDTTAPVITLNGPNPQIIELGDPYVEQGATTDDGSPVTLDTNISLLVSNVGTYSATYFAADAYGNSSTVFRTVEVVDTTAPVITLNGPNPQIIELGDPYVELGATTDDGSTITFDTNIYLFVSDVGTYTAMYFAIDDYGNSSIVFRTVEVVDTTAPVITLNGPNPQIIELGDPYVELGATTDDGSPVTLDTNINLLVSDVGTYSAMYFAADAYGNSSTVFRTVEVVDTTNPTVVCQNITVQLDDTGNASITAAMIDNGSADLSGIASIAIDITDFDCTNIGDNMVTLTVIDAHGNIEMCMATVTVEDNISPEFDITTVPTDMEVPFDTGDMYALADFTTDVVVTDNCDSNRRALATTITQSPVAGTLLGAGDHLITLTATDDNSNIETISFTITVSGILSVEENEEYLFTIYPNPAKDQVWITGLQGEAEVTISDINGRILRTIKVMNDQAISTRDLSEGVYLITIQQNNINQTMRLMKN